MAVKSFSTESNKKGRAFDLDGVRCFLNPHYEEQTLDMIRAEAALMSLDVEDAQEAAAEADKAEADALARLEKAQADLEANPASKTAKTELLKAEADRDAAREQLRAAAKLMRELMGKLKTTTEDTLRGYFAPETAQHLAKRLNDPGDPFTQGRLAEVIEWAQSVTAGRPTKP